MKKTLLVLGTALFTAVAFATVTGCVRDDNDDYYYYGNVTFWNDDPTFSDIVVTVDDSYTDRITTTYQPSYCNSTGEANFYLTEGRHYYRAHTVNGYTFPSGDFYVYRNDCTLVEVY